MLGLSNLVTELVASGIFGSVESLDYNTINKDHLDDIEAIFNNQKIKVQVYSGDDFESVAKKIIENAKFN
ncbi:hypothetical protein [Seonamhaeicola maritimus]|uniref:Uncharacterized protein n=1 Tax=Seonamhaeicola maritimus TaxID=2591822 RepID=A0A5C7GM54_9FLAO|nr:hypothetical protein [Seonamhaeicola maritimus]TXG39586.1 hypothetical protein FUA22_06885 [Seonamhaeicola maritimus]